MVERRKRILLGLGHTELHIQVIVSPLTSASSLTCSPGTLPGPPFNTFALIVARPQRKRAAELLASQRCPEVISVQSATSRLSMVSVTIFLSFFAALFFLPAANLKRAAEAEVVLNCNANVIPRLSAGGECQALRAKAIVGRPCCFDRGGGRDLLQGRPSAWQRRGHSCGPAAPGCPEPFPMCLVLHPGETGRPLNVTRPWRERLPFLLQRAKQGTMACCLLEESC